MKQKIKYISYIKEDQLESILEQKYPNKKCSECYQNSLYAGCVETQYDEKSDENVLLSFDVFCKECGAFITKWDNTNRQYLFDKR